MRILLTEKPYYTGELYRVHFENGISVEDVGDYLYERFEKVLGLGPQWVPDGGDVQIDALKKELVDLQNKKCAKCEENEKLMLEMKKQLAKKRE